MDTSHSARIYFVSEFSSWITDKFREWEKSTGRRQSVTSFARYLGVKQPSLNRWMLGDSTPDLDNIQKLAKKLGPETFRIAGAEVQESALNSLPPDLSLSLRAALDEIAATSLRQGSISTSEALRILESHGWKRS